MEINTGQSPAAIKNPLLAATRFLQGLGMSAKSHRGRDLLIHLPFVEDAILIYRQGGALSPTEMDTLYQWITVGGHLIVQPKRVLYEDDDIPETGDITREVGARLMARNGKADCGCPSNSDTANEKDDHPTDAPTEEGQVDEKYVEAPADKKQDPGDASWNDEEENENELLSVEIEGTQLTIDFPKSNYLEKGKVEPTFRIDSAEQVGAYLLQYRIGRGKLSVLSSTNIFDNANIDKAGRSWLLAWLVRDNAKTWLLYSNNMDGIFTLLVRHMPLFLVSLCGWVIFFIWAHQYRVGALREPKKRARCHILAHIDGLGRFNWHLDRADSLIARIREPLLQYWARRLPGKGNSPVDPAAAARLTGLTEDEVKTGLFGPVNSEQELVVVTRCLQKLLKMGAARKMKK